MRNVWAGVVVAASVAGCGGEPDAADSPKRVFITSIATDGNLGGLAGADTRCNTLADSAGLSSPWVAWLSDETTDAPDRVTGDGPWYQMGGTVLVAPTKASFSLTLASGVYRDELGRGINFTHEMWVGTQQGGTRTPGHTCNNWTDASMTIDGSVVQEQASGNGGGWGYQYPMFSTACIQQRYLACLEQ